MVMSSQHEILQLISNGGDLILFLIAFSPHFFFGTKKRGPKRGFPVANQKRVQNDAVDHLSLVTQYRDALSDLEGSTSLISALEAGSEGLSTNSRTDSAQVS
jgi:hypothetical protein